ncbi:hypothetical protein Ddye_026632 [Dipteronia dyeriana]|uniref:Uncharacterized protein n=1 Tax=Dipteronia dyeriana TaxID=168575 RepID=A0AAD9WQK8_9ROSI|nr:hypothetical protein Ddye_026632 [Dipteronia dyeriana]
MVIFFYIEGASICYTRQKFGVKWLKEKDKNTKFFHFVANGRTRSNRVSYVLFNGVTVSDPLQVRTGVFKFFKEHVMNVKWPRPKILGLSFNQISEAHRNSLKEAFTRKEVADDIVLFLEPKLEYLVNVKRILQCFELASRLRINFYKSCVVKVMAQGRRRFGISFSLNKESEKHLAPWKKKFLNKGERFVLIKLVLSSFPTYFLLVFRILVDIVVAVEKIQRIFLGVRKGKFTLWTGGVFTKAKGREVLGLGGFWTKTKSCWLSGCGDLVRKRGPYGRESFALSSYKSTF